MVAAETRAATLASYRSGHKTDAFSYRELSLHVSRNGDNHANRFMASAIAHRTRGPKAAGNARDIALAKGNRVDFDKDVRACRARCKKIIQQSKGCFELRYQVSIAIIWILGRKAPQHEQLP